MIVFTAGRALAAQVLMTPNMMKSFIPKDGMKLMATTRESAMTYDTWKTTNPEDEQIGDPPCKHETFSGVCMVCGAGPDEECEWDG
jgi:hypothetical protein